jgi:hypothetical protein
MKKASPDTQKSLKSKNIPHGLRVFLGFVLICLIGIGANLFFFSTAKPDEWCSDQCKRQTKVGRIVLVDDPNLTAGMRGKGRTVCECF